MAAKLAVIAALCVSIESKIVRGSGAEVVRGHGFAAPPPGHRQHGHNPLLLQQQSPQPQQQAVSQYEKPRKPIKTISEFDRPGSFQPMRASYSKQDFEPTTEKSFVSGPPLGDDFFDRYTEMIKRSQQKKKKAQLSFEGLLPSDLVDRRKRKHRDPPVPALYQIAAPVSLDSPSKPLEDFSFTPTGQWYGEPAAGLLQPPAHSGKQRHVSLDYTSPSLGALAQFSPNTNWFGEKNTGLFSYPSHLVPKRDSVRVTAPSKPVSAENFSPSGWHVYRSKVAETGTRASVGSSQDEPAIITLDNVAKFLKTQSHNSAGSNPDVFDVNVQAVIKTKDAPNVPKQFYLQV